MKYSPLLLLLSFFAFSACTENDGHNRTSFSAWLEEFRQEAKSKGISDKTLDDAFANTKPIPRIIELDRKQPEGTMTLTKYLSGAVSNSRIEQGRERLAENRELLDKIGGEYGVQPRFIVALWGIETSYGNNTGGFRTVDALATLAYDGRRADYFRGELLKALRIIEADHIEASDMQGSWAGALGQCQFMPSSFLNFAVDYDKDGKHDIWNTQEDVFASIANYLHSSGWDRNKGWGFPATLPDGFDRSLADIKQEKSFAEWQRLGVRIASGAALPDTDEQVSLILIGEGDDAASYLVTSNYKVILKWNRSRLFATAVGILSDSFEK